MLQAVLIDLDNTLILYDEPAFYVHFFRAIRRWFEDLVTEDELRIHLGRAMMSLKNGDGSTGNRERFVAGFCEEAKIDEDTFWERYTGFYAACYPQLPVSVVTPPDLQASMARLRGFGLPLVIATNPVFPVEAVRQRISWAGLQPDEFTLVTHIGNMHYVKPQQGYYRQIGDMIAVAPEDCLMVGNDPVNDMAAGTVGMHTFLTTDGEGTHSASIIDRSATAPEHTAADRPAPDFTGRFGEVPEAVARLLQGTGTKH